MSSKHMYILAMYFGHTWVASGVPYRTRSRAEADRDKLLSSPEAKATGIISVRIFSKTEWEHLSPSIKTTTADLKKQQVTHKPSQEERFAHFDTILAEAFNKAGL